MNQIIDSIGLGGETIEVVDRLKETLDDQKNFQKKYVLFEDQGQGYYRKFLETEESVRNDLDEMANLLASTKNKNISAG